MAAGRVIRLDIDAGGAGAMIVADYQRFLARWERGEAIGEDPAEDVKRFAARHAAGRAALAHLEHLFKVAALGRGEDTAEAALHDLDTWRSLMPPQSEEEPATDAPGSDG